MNYLIVWNKMPPNQWVTAKEINIAPATLTAMAKRGMIQVQETYPKTYMRIKNTLIKILFLFEKYNTQELSYILIYCKNNTLPMRCTIKDNNIYDCYGNPYSIANATSIRINKQWYSLQTGQEINNYE